MTNSETSGVELPDMDLLKKFDVPAPRYTSYPTADRFNAEFTAEDYARALAGRGTAKEPAPLSLYVHVPFCNDVCFYCGCNKIVTRDHSRSAAYIDLIGQEADLVKAHLTGSQELEQLHFGGGTPTFLTEDELELMMDTLTKRFPLAKTGGEFSIEVDPRTCGPSKVKKLREIGLNRMSLGVQDFNPDVQKAVNRIQPFEMTKETMDAARAEGFHSINMDLIYGLPKQTRETFAQTIDQVLELSPDRIALYHYAHLPNHFKPQRRILPADLPDTVTKVHIMFDAIKRLTATSAWITSPRSTMSSRVRRSKVRCSATSKATRPKQNATWSLWASPPSRRSAAPMPAIPANSTIGPPPLKKDGWPRTAAITSTKTMSCAVM